MVVEDVVMVGVGIVGLATAVALKRAGIQALVFERSKELRAVGAALTLYPNGWLALDALGVFHKFTFSESPSKRAIITDLGNGAEKEIKFTAANRF
ncbi:monooxygenase 3-like isoform X2 [Pistacia vera]|uniref:monooxygenase 3-like isoform X2 n=1 Tax=Pistacia vera TaxID=55513 RepID=UPI001263C59C|nr:monooxygenase 3-like isoform X2 [Pistacia vera]